MSACRTTRRAKDRPISPLLRSFVVGVSGWAAAVLPAGTLDYWQAWVLIAVFVLGSTLRPLSRVHDPELLERRKQAGRSRDQAGAEDQSSAS